MNTSFAEKVALITGGTSGIGRATAVAFAEQGANVVISGRRKAEGAESLSLIQKAGGHGLFVRGDVSEESEIETLVAKTLEHWPAPFSKSTNCLLFWRYSILANRVFSLGFYYLYCLPADSTCCSFWKWLRELQVVFHLALPSGVLSGPIN